MIFLIDQQLPRRLCDFIRGQGHVATHVKDIALSGAGDRDIWKAADRMGAIIVSKDEDFGLIVPVDGGPQTVWVRTGNCSNAVLLARFEAVWQRLIEELEAGAPLVELR